MKKTFIHYSLAFLVILGGCEQENITLQAPEVDLTNVGDEACPSNATAGSADFTKFVAIGNSLTAGFQAGALFNEGQQNSIPKILAQQFQCVGGSSTFNQPDINSENGFFTGGGNPAGNVVLGRLRLQGTPPVPTPTISDAAAIPNPQVNPGFLYSGDKTKLNNFGVPGILLGQIFLPQTGDWNVAGADPRFNPFYGRFASNPGNSTILQDATTSLANGGTFFMFWLGNNDVLGYATGGAVDGVSVPMTSTGDFTTYYNGAVNTLLSVPDVKGVVGNIPSVVAIPFFTTVAWNIVDLPQASADLLNTNLSANYNGFLEAMKQAGVLTQAEVDKRKLNYVKGKNGILINDETLTDLSPYMQGPAAGLKPYAIARHATAMDLICLPAGSHLGKDLNGDQIPDNGISIPLFNTSKPELKGDDLVLITPEIIAISTRIAEFNAIIKGVADASNNRIAYADVNTAYNQVLANAIASNGTVVNGVTINPVLAPPTGVFSEDGVHPNNRGYAFAANIFIDAINAKFGANIPKVNISKYKSTGLPINP